MLVRGFKPALDGERAEKGDGHLCYIDLLWLAPKSPCAIQLHDLRRTGFLAVRDGLGSPSYEDLLQHRTV
jgi:hypothetical protein